MPFYPMRCTFVGCQRDFEHHTKPDIYDQSRLAGFRDVRCAHCGSLGTAQRTYPRDSAPANLTVKGTWGKHASPGLKGKEFYTKQERDRQLSAVGSTAFSDGDNPEPRKTSASTTYKRSAEGKIEAVEKPKTKSVKASYDLKVMKPSEAIRKEATRNGGTVSLDGLVKETGIEKRRLLGGIMGAIRQGWLQKTDQERVYRLV